MGRNFQSCEPDLLGNFCEQPHSFSTVIPLVEKALDFPHLSVDPHPPHPQNQCPHFISREPVLAIAFVTRFEVLAPSALLGEYKAKLIRRIDG